MTCRPEREREQLRLPFPAVCQECGEVLLIGEAGLVCPNGHGRIVRDGFDDMKRNHPDRKIKH